METDFDLLLNTFRKLGISCQVIEKNGAELALENGPVKVDRILAMGAANFLFAKGGVYVGMLAVCKIFTESLKKPQSPSIERTASE